MGFPGKRGRLGGPPADPFVLAAQGSSCRPGAGDRPIRWAGFPRPSQVPPGGLARGSHCADRLGEIRRDRIEPQDSDVRLPHVLGPSEETSPGCACGDEAAPVIAMLARNRRLLREALPMRSRRVLAASTTQQLGRFHQRRTGPTSDPPVRLAATRCSCRGAKGRRVGARRFPAAGRIPRRERTRRTLRPQIQGLAVSGGSGYALCGKGVGPC